MPSHAEIDAEVAEKVLGWKPWRSKHGYFEVEVPGGEKLSSFGEYDYSMKYDPQTGKKLREPLWWEHIEVPLFSTYIEDAWKVVEKLHASDPPLFLYLTRKGPDYWLAAFHDAANAGDLVSAATAPLAICLAALKTVPAKV